MCAATPSASARRSLFTRSIVLRMHVSMPSESKSILSIPSASMSSLSHSIMVRSFMAASSMGTMSMSGPREITKPPTCCDRCLGNPRICETNETKCCTMGADGSSPAARNRSSLRCVAAAVAARVVAAFTLCDAMRDASVDASCDATRDASADALEDASAIASASTMSSRAAMPPPIQRSTSLARRSTTSGAKPSALPTSRTALRPR